VTAIVVCTAIGWSLDYWLGTRPWLMVLFVVLGAAAGINNAVKTALRMDAEEAERMKRRAERSSNKTGPGGDERGGG
jgi:ATP synthase protein I